MKVGLEMTGPYPRRHWKELIIFRSNWSVHVIVFCLVCITCLFGYYFLDVRLASLVAGAVGLDFLLSEEISHIPDLLFLMVCSITVLSWACHLYIVKTRPGSEKADFFEFIGSSVPLAYLLKMIFKIVFGKTNTRVWLFVPKMYGMHWFHGGGEFSAFPSGHMAVFAAMMFTIVRYFPRYRRLCWGFLALMGAALIATEYHFFSDVVAGTYVGWIVDRITNSVLCVRYRPGLRICSQNRQLL